MWLTQVISGDRRSNPIVQSIVYVCVQLRLLQVLSGLDLSSAESGSEATDKDLKHRGR